MRFNTRELSCLAHQTSDRFDKEGVLIVKEKQEGIFRSGEIYIERLFRLRGNLLFYFKNTDVTSDVLGVIVLERCIVQLEDDENDYYTFTIVFEGDEKVIHLFSQVESERDAWISRIHIASYECIKIQLQSLREQLRMKTGRDPIDDRVLPPVSENLRSQRGLSFEGQELEAKALSLSQSVLRQTCLYHRQHVGTTDLVQWLGGLCNRKVPKSGIRTEDDVFLELSFACRGLPTETNGRAPDTFAAIHYLFPPHGESWVTYAHTEVVEKNCDPIYLTTAGFGSTLFSSVETKVKVIIYDVKERMTNTMTEIGWAICTMSDILDSIGQQVHVVINSADARSYGSVIILAWRCNVGELTTNKLKNNVQLNSKILSKIPLDRNLSVASVNQTTELEQLKILYANINTKTFRFPIRGSSDNQLVVHEYMGEGRLTYTLPIQFLELLIEEEKSKITQLEDLGSLVDTWEKVSREVIDFHCSMVATYQQHARHLASIAASGTSFKPSAKKSHKEVEFAATNLHIQRMVVYNTTSASNVTYDVLTVGAFTAGALKYKHGGLRRIMGQLDHVSTVEPGKGRLVAVGTELGTLSELRSTTDVLCDRVCSSAVQGDASLIMEAMLELERQTRLLITSCDSPLVNDGVLIYSTVHSVSSGPSTNSVVRKNSVKMSPRLSVESRWKWSGTDFIKSPTDEPWDLTRLNTEAALVCVRSKVDELILDSPQQAAMWLSGLSPHVIKLKRCLEVMCARAKAGLVFILLQECGQNMSLIHSLTYRRDVVFSQALTAATTGFLTKLYRSMDDRVFLEQISQFGVLMQFESLVSCYGDEMAMLEDMGVGVSDLSKLIFTFERVAADADSPGMCPSVSGDRSAINVTLPLPSSIYDQLPTNFLNKSIRVVPVMFNIGINEQATLAEKFGNVSLQEKLNEENHITLHNYYQNYVDWQRISNAAAASELASLDDLMQRLYYNVMLKKCKNTEVLQYASSVCLALNGVRFTSCKSAKDRSAMAVTLEQVLRLKQENDLEPDFFMHALQCMRSEGVRRENSLKNAGVRKYAFNSLQILSLPKLYRPPSGTYGNYDT